MHNINRIISKLTLINMLTVSLLLSLAHISNSHADNYNKNPSPNNIIIIAMPKSGSEYLSAILAHNLHFTPAKISQGTIPEDQIILDKMRLFFTEPHKISKQHINASGFNIQTIKYHTNKIVLHIRDPRAVLLSWVYHQNKLYKAGKIELLARIYPAPPQEYYALGLHAQIDWNIENFLPGIINWLNTWLSVMEAETAKVHGLQILLTTYDELITNEQALYHKISDFYMLRKQNMPYEPAAKTAALNFRNGDPKEWQQVFTTEQKLRIDALLSTQLLHKRPP